jgi:hypothetical protein
MISKQTKVLLLIGVVCLGIRGIWQNYSHVAFKLSHSSITAKTGPGGGGEWDPGSLWVHQPVASDFLVLVGAFGLLFTTLLLIGDIKLSRQHRRSHVQE